MNLSRRVMKWLFPKADAERQAFRMVLNKHMANAEDLERTVYQVNGHAREFFAKRADRR